MKRVFHNITVWFRDLTAVFCNEWRIIVHDMGALIFFLALPLLYPVVYTLIYNTEVVDKVPVAIIDDCRSEMSRQFVRDASAAPGIDVVGYAANLNEARRWMNEDKVYGILRIPSDYASDIETGQQATIEFYADMSLLLRYRALLAAVTDLQIKQTADITMNRVNMTGLETTGMAKMPIDSHHSFLGDPEQGFASFVMPGIVILILQQSMLLGISLIGGTSRERRMRNGGIDPEMIDSASASASVWGK
ncbi:MAG: ABC transporter permease, partial [Muribaculaceae bacterium]|nr:ABC transporter permease [Muribaculaceae bacterium]